MTKKRLIVACLALSGILAIAVVVWGWSILGGKRTQISVGKDTTVITGPRAKDGRIDYVAVLDADASRGVTPDDNAAVVLWEIVGPSHRGRRLPERFFAKIGMPSAPSSTNRFVPLSEFIEQEYDPENADLQSIRDAYDVVLHTVWSPGEFPLLTKWVDANSELLDRMVEGSRRRHFYSPGFPMVGHTEEDYVALVNVDWPALFVSREVCKALVARGMLRMWERRAEESLRDIQACRRLGRLAASGQSVIHFLSGSGCESMANYAEVRWLHRFDPDAMRCRELARELAELPPSPQLHEVLDRNARFEFLDSVQAYVMGDSVLDQQPPIPPAMINMVRPDGDLAMREGNRLLDDTVRLVQLPYYEASKRVEALNAELQSRVSQATSMGFSDILHPTASIRESLSWALVSIFRPAVTIMLPAATRHQQERANLRLVIALAAFHADNGQYPEQLEQLAPRYIDSIPQDLFSRKPLTYRRTDDGYLFYSVGQNLTDDGGRMAIREGRDDVGFRIPPLLPDAQ